MDKYSELLSSFFSQLRERLTSPLLGAFIFFWLAFNWKPISVYLFSDRSIEDSIQHIQLHYSNAQLNFWYPFLATSIYLVVYPFFSWASFSLWEWFEKTKGSTRAKIFGSEYLTAEQSLALKQRYADKHEEIRRLLKMNEAEVANINDSLEAERLEISKLKNQNNELADSLEAVDDINLAEILPIPEVSKKLLTRYKDSFVEGFNAVEHLGASELSYLYDSNKDENSNLRSFMSLTKKDTEHKLASDLYRALEPLINFKLITKEGSADDNSFFSSVYKITRFGERYLHDLSGHN